MIKSLRKKFIAVTMCAIAVVLGGMIGIINTVNYYQIDRRQEAILTMLSNNGGEFPETTYHRRSLKPLVSPEAPFTTRYFNVVLDKQGEIVSINTGKIIAVSTRVAGEYAQKLFREGKTKGFIGNYKYNKIDYPSYEMYVFLDCGEELATFYSFLFASIFVGLLGMMLVFILVLFFSRIVVKPVAESYEKQKRFITDASHELKTPLAIIDASTEVLEMEQGENEWTTSIKNQIRRLSTLTEKLVFLSRMDEDSTVLSMEEVSFSSVVSEMAESFQAVAAAQEKTLYLEIEDAVSVRGNEATLRQLVSILLDNAMKYSDAYGTIVVSLHKAEKKTELIVKNTVDSVPKGNLDILFERFYRMDQSRNSETGGYGIGLSVAKAIVAAHKGNITAGSDDGKVIIFRVSLP